MINDILTRPRPGGLPSTGVAGVGQTLGSGMAGVASNADAEGIRLYNDRTNYKEWEFIYDYSKDRGPAVTAGIGSPAGTPASELGQQPGAQQPGTPTQPGVPAAPGAFPGTSPFGGGLPAGLPQMPPTTSQPFPPRR
jgi:hypothetical protein